MQLILNYIAISVICRETFNERRIALQKIFVFQIANRPGLLYRMGTSSNCKQYVSKATVKVFNSLQDKELQQNSMFLLTTGSVVQIRAGELKKPVFGRAFLL